jgi:hypothetical protein
VEKIDGARKKQQQKPEVTINFLCSTVKYCCWGKFMDCGMICERIFKKLIRKSMGEFIEQNCEVSEKSEFPNKPSKVNVKDANSFQRFILAVFISHLFNFQKKHEPHKKSLTSQQKR